MAKKDPVWIHGETQLINDEDSEGLEAGWNFGESALYGEVGADETSSIPVITHHLQQHWRA